MSGLTSLGAARDALAARQREVLDHLLAGSTPDGFDARGTAMTTRVLLGKRADAVARVAPEVEHLPGWRDLFRAWAASHPTDGCAHDDLRGFVASLGEHPWVALHEVHDGRRRLAWTRLDGRRVLVVGVGDRVWVLRRRTFNLRSAA